jgi:hypothetical protein
MANGQKIENAGKTGSGRDVVLIGGAVGKDAVSRVWRKVKSDWDAWNARSLAAKPIVRLILDGTVVRALFKSIFCLGICLPVRIVTGDYLFAK